MMKWLPLSFYCTFIFLTFCFRWAQWCLIPSSLPGKYWWKHLCENKLLPADKVDSSTGLCNLVLHWKKAAATLHSLPNLVTISIQRTGRRDAQVDKPNKPGICVRQPWTWYWQFLGWICFSLTLRSQVVHQVIVSAKETESEVLFLSENQITPHIDLVFEILRKNGFIREPKYSPHWFGF